MTRTRLTPLLLALLSAALLAGCGGGSKSSSTSTSAASTATSTATTPATTVPTSTSVAGLSGPQRVQACRNVVSSLEALPLSAKQKIEGICAKAGTSSVAELRKDAENVCGEVLGSSTPASVRDRVIAICRGIATAK